MTSIPAIQSVLFARQERGSSVRRPSLNPGIVSVLGLGLGLGVVAALAWFVSLPVAGIVYAAAYMLLTWTRPELALMLMFAAAPFPYDLGGGPIKMALGEINFVLATPVLIIKTIRGAGRLTRNPIKWPVLAYFVVCIVSSLIAGITNDGIIAMAQMGLYLVLAVFVFSSCVPDLRCYFLAFSGFLLGTAALAAMGLVSRQEYLIGIHKNAVGTNLSYAVIICAELWLGETDRRRRRWLGALGCILLGGLLFSMSRGAWIGAIAGLAVMAALRRQFKLLVRGLAVAIVIVAVLWQLVPSKEQQYATDLSLDAHNVKSRLISIQYAMHYFETSPMLGVGVGLRKEYDATNVVMSTLAETGVLGLITFLGIFVAFAASVRKTAKILPQTNPLFSLLAIGAALSADQLAHGCVDHYWNRVLLPVWGGVGMAFYAQQKWRSMARTSRLEKVAA